MTVDVEARLRAASGSLRLASQRLPHEELPRPRTRPLAFAAAVVVVAALAAGLALFRQDDNDQIVVDTPRVPRLIPDDYPEELPPPMGFELPMGEPLLGAESASVVVFGDPAAANEDPFDRADLAVAETTGDVASFLLNDSDPVTVRGHDGQTWDDSRLGSVVTWDEAPGRTFVAASHLWGRVELLAAVEDLTLDGDNVAVGSTPSGPVTLVGEIPDLPLAALLMGMAPSASASAEGYMVGNETDDYELGLFITTVQGDASDAAVLRWLTRAGDAVEVRGHDGWTGTTEVEGRTSRTLIWEEAPGVVAVVQATGFDQAQVVAAADGLRQVGDDEWEQMLTEFPTIDGTGDPTEEEETGGGGLVFIDGEYADGTWSVYAEATGSVCGEVLPTDPNLDSIDVCAPAGAPVAVLYDTDGQPLALYGELPEGTVAVEPPDSWSGPDDIVREAGDGRLFYALPVDGAVPATVVFHDDEGRPVTTVDVEVER